MATKRKSIIEEALLDAKSLEDALKANTKEMLSAHMSKEIESIVESSLREQDEETIELDDIELEGSADDEEDVELNLDDELTDDSEEEESEELEMDVMDFPDDGEEMADVELDLDTDLDLDGGEGEELELDLEPMGMELGMGDDVLDMTMASDSEVVTVFKKLGPDDEVEVVKDADGIHLTDNETGAEYYIKESLDEMMDENDGVCEGCGVDEDEIVYEIEMNEDEEVITNEDDEDPLEEDHTLARTKGRQRKGGHRNRQTSESRKSRKPLVRESRNRKVTTKRKVTENTVNKVSYQKLLKEYKILKGRNTEYKEALKVFKTKINEVALFNQNLAHVTKLFTEHSTTKKEKMKILGRFDNVETVKESKTLYKSIEGELSSKTPINESIDKKVNKTIDSSKSNLNESSAYVDPSVSKIKDLMKRMK